MNHLRILIIALFAALSVAEAYELTTAKGIKMKVQFLGWNDDTVALKNARGRKYVVRMSAISKKDQDWVRKHVPQDFSLAKQVPARSFTLQDGRKVTAQLVGLKGMKVELAGKGDTRVEVPLFRFSEEDQDFIVQNAPHIDALNANPSVRHDPIMIENVIKKMDRLLLAQYKQNGVTPNPIVDDSIFLRRAYLSVIGRVPTAEEARDFLDNDNPDKRKELINELYEHEGYVHHMYNYWADLLRIKTRLPGRNYGAAYYAQWVKDKVRENKPYDEMVKDMLTATGYYWDNPAVGFYRRDLGMPLDNLAVMCQTLLGTSIVCAQCHDHPFDTWTQKQYFEMAAYTYPMSTRTRPQDEKNIQKVQQLAKEELGKRGVNAFMKETRYARQNLIDYPLKSGNEESKRRLKYPKEYQYANAKPGQVVKPKTPFGESAYISDLKNDHTIAPFVKWFTSPKNPRFARNISNRLWKETFGLGLIEPVDEIKASSKPFNPQLMSAAEKLLLDLKFDVKTFQKVLHQTQYFQRAAHAGDVNPVEGYDMSGPLLRRLTAEQLWDSVVGMIVPDVDRRVNPRLLAQDTAIALQGQATLKMPPQQIFATLKEQQGLSRKQAQKKNQMAMQGMKGMQGMQSMQPMMGAYGKKAAKVPATFKINPKELEGLSPRERKKKIGEQKRAWEDARRKADPFHGFNSGYIRAAEMSSPAPGGHFLNMFGQSDREMTENDNQEASIPQVLTLMNDSAMLDYLMKNPRSVLTQELNKQDSDREKIDAIFLSTLSRKATDKEWQALKQEVSEDGSEGTKRILWAVINSQAFRFME